MAVAGLCASDSFGGDWFLDLHDDRHHSEVYRQDAEVVQERRRIHHPPQSLVSAYQYAACGSEHLSLPPFRTE